MRFGVFFQNEHTTSKVVSSGSPGRMPTATRPATCRSRSSTRHSKTGQLYGAYLQDEWKLTPKLTLNYGARYDVVRAYTKEQQLSPRANLVWNAAPLTTFHIGYARNFTPPPQELIAPATVALYNGTTKQSEIKSGDPVKAEREHYFDAGVEQRFNGGFKIGLDAYYKIKRNLLDEGQFGSAVVLSPFNYAKGYAWGVELSGNYTHGPIDLYANVARGDEKAKDIVSSQYFFAPDELAYIHDHYIFTDHSQKWTASGGGSYTIHDGLGTLVPTADFIYASGLRTDDPERDRSQRRRAARLFRVQRRHRAEFQRPGRAEGREHPRRRAQPVRQELSDPQRRRRRRRRPAMGPAARLLRRDQRRSFEDRVTKEAVRRRGGRTASRLKRVWGDVRFGTDQLDIDAGGDRLELADAFAEVGDLDPAAGGRKRPVAAEGLGQLHLLELEPAVPGLEPCELGAAKPGDHACADSTPIVSGSITCPPAGALRSHAPALRSGC